MENLIKSIIDEGIIQFVISNPIWKSKTEYVKIVGVPVRIGQEDMLQLSCYTKTQVFHKNLSGEEITTELLEWMMLYKQTMIFSKDGDHQIFMNKKGVHRHMKKAPTKVLKTVSHNREKHYILNNGEPVDFLIHLGVMDANGNVHKKMYDKFRQINRYLEFVDDTYDSLKDKEFIRIVDFGCGKAYLTFALYYYFVTVKKKIVEIIGLDLKKEVINNLNKIKEELKYDDLKFICGDIKDYYSDNEINMVISLHACDTATDISIIKAVEWGADVILAVPCCQKEINRQLEVGKFPSILSYGLMKERFATILTDTIRANVLKCIGYDAQMLEFIDMQHTPKNVLIRARKTDKRFDAVYKDLVNTIESYEIKQTLYDYFSEKMKKTYE